MKDMNLKKKFIAFLFLTFLSINLLSSQNIYSLEPIQVVGQMNGYSTSSNSNTTYRKISTSAAGNPTDGRGQWIKTYNVQSSGGDFTPRNMIGGSGAGFLFVSGPSTNRFANKWVFSGVAQGSVNAVNVCNAYNSGNDMGLNMNTVGKYTFVFNDAGYSSTNAKYYVAYTSSTPITVSRTSEILNIDRSANISITTNTTPSFGENIFVRYTTSNDFSSANTSSVVQATGLNTSWSANIPAQAIGSTVRYYIFTSTISLATLNSMSEIDKSLATLNYDDNSGSNYAYNLTSNFTSVTSGNFTDLATWGVSQIFSGASYTIANSNTVNLNQDFTVQNLTLNSGGNFNNNSFTLNIATNGSIINNGDSSTSFNANSGKINFIGTGSISGSKSTILNKLTINSGTVTLTTVPFINDTFQINGGNVSAAPIYSINSTLLYNTTYSRFNEWNYVGIGTIGTSAGYPNNVTIAAGTFNLANSSTAARAMYGSLNINSGATLNVNSANMLLTVGGNIANNGTFNSATTGTIALANNSTITGNTLILNNLTINGITSLGQTIINGQLTLNNGSSINSGTPNYGSSATLIYNYNTNIGSEWPTANGPFNITLNASIGLLELDGNKTINGTLTINNGSTLDVGASNYTITFGNNSNFINNGTFNSNSGTINFNGLSTISGNIAFYKVNILSGVNFGTLSTVNDSLNIKPGGYIINNPPTYGSSSTLNYSSGATYIAGTEWTSGTESGRGVPNNILISNNTNLSFGTTAAYRQLLGNIIIENGSTITLSSNIGGDIKIKGSWQNNNIAIGTGFVHNNRALICNGSGNQYLNNLSGRLTIGYLLINKTNGSLILNDSLFLNGTATGTAQVLQLLNNGNLDLNGNVLTINGGQVRSILCNNTSNLITGSENSQINFASGTGIALIEGTGNLTIDSNIYLSINKGVNFGLNKTTIKGTLEINEGSFCSVNSPLYTSSSTLVYKTGSYTQSNEWTSSNYPSNIKINLLNSSNSITLLGNRSISGTLSLLSGNINTNNDTLKLLSNSSIIRTNGHIIGNLSKYFPIGSNISKTYEVGTNLGYTPITLNFPNITTDGFITLCSKDSDNVNISSSGLKPNKSVNRNWLINSTTVAPISYNIELNYLNSDNDTLVNYSNYKLNTFNFGTWVGKVNASGTPNATIATYSGISSFGSIQIAEDSTTSAGATLNLTAYLQGLYIGAGIMTSAPFNYDGVSPNSIADTITVELHEAASPYNTVFSVTGILSTTGNANLLFPSGAIGNYYYIAVKHRNSIETWSSDTIQMTSVTNYDFSSAAGQAYGNNLIDDGTGIFLLYSGDINQDGSVDFADYPDLDLGSSNGDIGYLATDLNGDSSIDFADYPLIDSNSSLGIILFRP